MTGPEAEGQAEEREVQRIRPGDVGAVEEVLGASIGEGEEPASEAPTPIRDADPGDQTEFAGKAPDGDQAEPPSAEDPQPEPREANLPVEPGPFHVAGAEFKRLEDGTVTITRVEGGVAHAIKLDPDSWCSAVAAVSVYGDTAESFECARGLHNGNQGAPEQEQ